MTNPELTIEKITPAKARKYLEGNTANRTIKADRPPHSLRYVPSNNILRGTGRVNTREGNP